MSGHSCNIHGYFNTSVIKGDLPCPWCQRDTLIARASHMSRHLKNAVKTMREMGTQSGQTISTAWVLNMAEAALPYIPEDKP